MTALDCVVTHEVGSERHSTVELCSNCTALMKPQINLESPALNAAERLMIEGVYELADGSLEGNSSESLNHCPPEDNTEITEVLITTEDTKEPFKENSVYNMRRRKIYKDVGEQPKRKGSEAKTEESGHEKTRTPGYFKSLFRPGRRVRYPLEWGPRSLTWSRTKHKKWDCEHCGETLSSGPANIAKHYRRFHLWGNFYCSFCKFLGFYPDVYEAHMIHHHADMEGGVAAKCPVCDCEILLTSTSSALAEHYRECSKVWKKPNKKAENDSPTVTCDVCGK